MYGTNAVRHAVLANKQPSDATTGEQRLCKDKESSKPPSKIFLTISQMVFFVS
jgi:hypothetical protein